MTTSKAGTAVPPGGDEPSEPPAQRADAKTTAVDSLVAGNGDGYPIAARKSADVPQYSVQTMAPTTLAVQRAVVVPAVSVTQSSPLAGLLAVLGLGPISSTDPLQPTPRAPLTELFWTAIRRFESSFFNKSPVAAPTQIGETDEGVIVGTIGGSDPDGDPLRYTISHGPERGVVVLDSSGNYVYSPNADLAREGGTDSFIAEVDEVNAASHIHGPLGLLSKFVNRFSFGLIRLEDGSRTFATVTVSVTPASVAPVVGTPPFELTVSPSTGVVTGKVNVTPANGKVLTYQLASTVGSSVGAVTVDPTTGAFVFTPATQARYNAFATQGAMTVSFTVTASDGQNSTNVDVVSPLSPRNPSDDLPLASSDLRSLVNNSVVEVSENRDGTVRAIDGKFVSTTVKDSSEAANVLNRIADLLGAPNGFADSAHIITKNTELTREDGNPYTEAFYALQQTVNGIPVVGGSVILATDQNGTVTGVFSNFVGGLQGDTTPAAPVKDNSEAIRIAKFALAASLVDELGEDEANAAAESYTFTSSLQITRTDMTAPMELFWQVVAIPQSSSSGSDAALSSDPDVIVMIHANGSRAGSSQISVLELTAVTQAPKAPGANGTSTLATSKSQVPMPSNVVRALAYYTTHFQFHYVPGHDRLTTMIVSTLPEISAAGNTADEQPLIVLGYGSEDALDVVAHELTHTVVAAIIGNGDGLKYGQESRSLGEAYADVMGALIENKSDATRYIIGEDIPRCDRKSITYKCALRDIKTPYKLPVNSDAAYSRYSEFDRTSVTDISKYGKNSVNYSNSTIFSSALVQMMTDKRLNGVSSISGDSWAKVFYGSLYRLGSAADFGDARSAVISSARAQGFTEQQLTVVRDAFYDHGLDRIAYQYGKTVTIDLGSPYPHDIAMSADGSRAYVITSNNQVKILDPRDPVGAPSQAVIAGVSPSGIAVSVNGERAYVSDSSSNSVSIIRYLGGAFVTSLDVGGTSNGVAVSSDGTRAYVTKGSANTVAIVDYSTNFPVVRAEIPTANRPTDVALSADGSRAYIVNSLSNTVTIVNDAGLGATETVTVSGTARSVVASSDGTRAVVYSTDGSVDIIDHSGAAPVVTRVPGFFDSYDTVGFMAMSADGKRVWITQHDYSNTVALVELDKPTVVTYFTLNDLAHSVATTADGSKAFVVTHGSLYILDTHGTTQANIYPTSIAINNSASDYQQVAVSSDGRLVAATDVDGRLSILDSYAL